MLIRSIPAIDPSTIAPNWYVTGLALLALLLFIASAAAVVVRLGKRVVTVPLTILGVIGLVCFAGLSTSQEEAAREKAANTLSDQINEVYGVSVNSGDAWRLYKGESLFVKHDGDQVLVQLLAGEDETLVLTRTESIPLPQK